MVDTANAVKCAGCGMPTSGIGSYVVDGTSIYHAGCWAYEGKRQVRPNTPTEDVVERVARTLYGRGLVELEHAHRVARAAIEALGK